MKLSEVKALIEQEGEVRIDCGQGSFREVILSEYRNSTEAAIAAIECAKYSPCMYDACESGTMCDWESRIH